MLKPLSISAYRRFSTCSKYYYYYDVEKVPQAAKTSALVLGSIFDSAVNKTLLGKSFNLSNEFNYDMFNDVEFYPDDFDKDLVDIELVEKSARDLGWKGDDVTQALKDFLSEQSKLSEKQRKFIQYACTQSLEVKFRKMFDGFGKYALPEIVEVYDVQKYLLHDVSGGQVHGYLDTKVKLKDGRTAVLDIKTAKQAYGDDAVQYSPQLAAYAHIEKVEYAGFIVCLKTLSKNKIKTCTKCGYEVKGGNLLKCPAQVNKKRCSGEFRIVMNPTSYCQVLVDNITSEQKNLTIDALQDTIKSIDTGIFPRNLEKCKNIRGVDHMEGQFGKSCQFLDRCWKNKI